MRLHRLEVTAFGPYADTQTVDFDALNDAGVFLMTGPTGAGKTSILDAVCYALYAVVPGDREVRGLRSDHAPAERAPRVELELTLCGRRLRVVRAPEWRRPKRRGTGTTREPALARLFEIDPDGTERLVSDRAQEVGHELCLMLGMSSEQFMQVVLLPQSGFHTFLKARSDDRREVLEKLFSTQRFSRIEEWMHDRARVVRQQAQETLAQVRTQVAVMRDRSGGALPDDLMEPFVPGDAPRLVAWAGSLVDRAETAAAELASETSASGAAAEAAEEHADVVRRLHLLAQRRDRALADRAALDEGAPAAAQDAALLDADDRARSVAPLLAPLDRARARAAQALAEVERATQALGKPTDEADPSDPPDPQVLLGDLTSAEHTLRALRPRAVELRQHADAVSAASGALAAAEEEAQVLADERESLPETRTRLEEALAAARDRATRLELATGRREDAAGRLDAARTHALLVPRLAAAEAAERSAHTAANDARSHALDLVARRLEGIAAELASGLLPGEACQVCGSTDHPRPARPAGDVVREVDQDAAQQASEAARVAHDQARRTAETLRSQVAASRLRAGGHTVGEAEGLLREAEADVVDAHAAGAERDELELRLQQLDRRIEATATAHEAASSRVADLRARRDASVQARDDAASALREALQTEDEHPRPEDLAVLIEDRLADLAHRTHLARALAEATTAADGGQAALAEALTAAEEAAHGAGFADLAAARDALLDPAARRAGEQRRDERAAALARVAGVLAEPDLVALADTGAPPPPHTAPDLARADDDARAARRHAARTTALHEQAEQQVTALRAQADQLASAVAAWAPAETEAARVGDLASLVRGSGDNRLRMRLSSYVLATRLDQVLAAANDRLSQMRDTRYVLQRTDKARRAGSQAGLDLEVLDEWTGEVRPPSSLSGGECFVVSLALALGLADVIGEESGGVEVDTLFIDEGFGTLDPETLDQVMDRIDDLRSGGRAVGVVSHVSELRSRITTQVHVHPGRTGSRIAIAHGDA